MRFSEVTKSVAFSRQCRRDGQGRGAFCAKCCNEVGLTFDPYHVPRIPIAKGGRWTKDNCIVLCEKCFSEIGFDHPEIISWSELPCYRR